MKIAVTSQNFRTVTAHAGKTRRFLVYDAGLPCAPRELARLDLPPDMAFHAFRGEHHPLDGVIAILTRSAGEGFVARMAQRGVDVVICDETAPLQAIQAYLGGTARPAPVRGDHACHHGLRAG